MGTLLAVFLVISLNMAPGSAQSLAIDSYVVEGVGIYPDATTFLLTKNDDGTWLLYSAQGNPWYTVGVNGPNITLTSMGGDTDTVDMGAALGLPSEEWWATGAVEPPGFTPILLSHLDNGVNVSIDGLRAAEVRW